LASFAPMPTSCAILPRRPIIPVETLIHCQALPNPSLKLTRYGRHCKPGLRYFVHCLSPGLQYLPTRAAKLER
jgi:hypothetical protein